MALSSKWFYTHNGKDKPRVTLPELLDLFCSGTITDKTYVWHKSHCKQWTPVAQVTYVMDQIESKNYKNSNRMQPSIIRSSNSNNSKNSIPNVANLSIIQTMSASNTSNNTSSEIQEIAVNESFAAISESEDDHDAVQKTITSIAPHIIDEQRMHHHHSSKAKNNKVQGYSPIVANSLNHSITSVSYYSNSNNNMNEENYAHNTHYEQHRSKRKSTDISSHYRVAQLVEISDPQKFRGIVYGLVAEIRHNKIAIKYNNKAFGKEWFDIDDERVSVVTDPLKKQQHGPQRSISSEDDAKTDKMSSRVVLPSNNYNFKKAKSKKRHSRHKSQYRTHKEGVIPRNNRSKERTTKSSSLMHNPSDLLWCRRKSTILNTVNMNEEKLSLLSERKLLNLERGELQREHEKFFYCKKKHETEVWAVKNDYIEQTKKLKKQYVVYKQTCDDLMIVMNANNVEQHTNHLLLKYHKLTTKEKLIKDNQKAVDKKQKTAQILYETATHLLQKVQDATLKMDVYAKLCDEKCDNERELIKKQEMDRKKYLNKLNKLRDEMLSAPWLLLSSDMHTKPHTKHDMEKLHNKLAKTYNSIREERRKFLPVQRKWAKLIMKHQIYAQDEKAFMNIRSKLENIRSYEKEYKLSVFEEIKSMFDGSNSKLKAQALDLKERQILLNYKVQLMEDKERQIRNEKKLLRLQQRNLEESITELEYERELISAQKSTLHSRMNKEKLEDLSSQISTEGPYRGREQNEIMKYDNNHRLELEKKYQQLIEKLDAKTNELNDTKHKLQDAMHRNDKLQIQLTHFEESVKKENHDKEAKQQGYEKFSQAMETLTQQFQQMMGIKDEEMKKMDEMLNEWKTKAVELQQSNGEIQHEKKTIHEMMEQLKQQNKELIAQNDQLEYTVPQLTIENEHLREQIQEMIISSNEALKSHEELRVNTPTPTKGGNHITLHPINVTAGSMNEEEIQSEEEELLDDDMDDDLLTTQRLKTPTIIVANIKDTKQKKKRSSKSKKKKMMKTTDENNGLLAIDDEAENMLSDNSNYEETADMLSAIRSQLASSDETGRLISKHESQNSMTAIVDLVKKTKFNMESQSIDLEILADKPSSIDDEHEDFNMSLLTQNSDDSFSEHVQLIENMLIDPEAEAAEKDKMHHKKKRKKTKRKGHKKKKKKKKKKDTIRLKHSDEDIEDALNEDMNIMEDDIMDTYLVTPDTNDSNELELCDDLATDDDNLSSSDEPPIFWNHDDQNDRITLERMISDPDQVLDDVMSPKISTMHDPYANDELSSDWDEKENTKLAKLYKKTKKAKKKPKHKKRKKSMDGTRNKKNRKKKGKHKRNKTMQ